MIIAIDFDDTITEPSKFPVMGKIKEDAVRVIKKLQEKHTLILWTCREGVYLDEAINALDEVGIKFENINEYAGSGRKVYADVYIDDRAFGGCVDWNIIENKLLN